MNDDKRILRQALIRQGRKMQARGRVRTILAVILLLLGAGLVYFGLSRYSPFLITLGIIFVLYAIFMRFHVRKTHLIMKELEDEIEKRANTQNSKERDATQSPAAPSPDGHRE